MTPPPPSPSLRDDDALPVRVFPPSAPFRGLAQGWNDFAIAFGMIGFVAKSIIASLPGLETAPAGGWRSSSALRRSVASGFNRFTGPRMH